MSKDHKKVPGAVIIIVVVIVAAIAFIPTVYMPYKNKKPGMDQEHEEALAQIQLYEDSIANQAAIEQNVEELSAEWDQYQQDMFVDASSSLDDIQQACDEIGVNLMSFNRGNETQDPSEAYSFTGSPLYYVTLNMTMYVDRDTLNELLTYIEDESIGCYYVRTLNAKTQEESKDMGNFTVEEGDLFVSMEVELYYYNQKITIDPSLLETDTDTEAEAAE